MEWISVKDRLPSEEESLNGSFLVICKTFGGYRGSYISVEMADFLQARKADQYTDYYTEEWVLQCETMYHPFEITHWMPLPDPPK